MISGNILNNNAHINIQDSVTLSPWTVRNIPTHNILSIQYYHQSGAVHEEDQHYDCHRCQHCHRCAGLFQPLPWDDAQREEQDGWLQPSLLSHRTGEFSMTRRNWHGLVFSHDLNTEAVCFVMLQTAKESILISWPRFSHLKFQDLLGVEILCLSFVNWKCVFGFGVKRYLVFQAGVGRERHKYPRHWGASLTLSLCHLQVYLQVLVSCICMELQLYLCLYLHP